MMTTVPLLGLLFRQRRGPGGIGIESTVMLGIYATAIAIQTL